jgi:mRNA-degrading endonuclease YafQ of YafQ-DinJ toxin-antitoxin module
VIVEYTKSFDRNFSKLQGDIQKEVKDIIREFLNFYTRRQFPKSLRAHKCGPFISLSASRDTRVFVSPISSGVRFVFVGNHKDADDYLKRY